MSEEGMKIQYFILNRKNINIKKILIKTTILKLSIFVDCCASSVGERSPHERDIGVRSPVATDLGR